MKLVYVAMPVGWTWDNTIEVLNTMAIQIIGDPLFFETEEECDKYNKNSGVSGPFFTVEPVTFGGLPRMRSQMLSRDLFDRIEAEVATYKPGALDDLRQYRMRMLYDVGQWLNVHFPKPGGWSRNDVRHAPEVLAELMKGDK